jgi:hypothetical protein
MSPKIFFACSKSDRHITLTVSIHVLGSKFPYTWPILMTDGKKVMPNDFIILSHSTSLIAWHEGEWRSVVWACENGSNSEIA